MSRQRTAVLWGFAILSGAVIYWLATQPGMYL